MPDFSTAFQDFVEQLRLPIPEGVLESMDFVAWVLVALVAVAIAVGVSFSLTMRRSFLKPDALESSPDLLLARVKQDPTRMPPVAIISRLGAEATLELLEYGDQISTNEWRYRWSSVREELLRLLSGQNAFGPTHALARYYRAADRQEPETLRIRRTALIHKLGLQRYLEPDLDANPRDAAHPRPPRGGGGRPGLRGRNLLAAARRTRAAGLWAGGGDGADRVSHAERRGTPSQHSALAHGGRRLSADAAQAPRVLGGRRRRDRVGELIANCQWLIVNDWATWSALTIGN
jgi:hypothetical protein